MSLLALDVGGTYVKYGLWHEEQLQFNDEVLTPKSWTAFLQIIAEIMEKMQNKADTIIEGLACSFPGVVNTKTGWIGGYTSVPYIHGMSVTEALEDYFKLPVSIENDAKCALLAEHRFGNAKGHENVALMVIGTGIGGALMINGKLHKGRNLYAGELGCILMDHEIMLSDIGSTARMIDEFKTIYEINTPVTGRDIFEMYDQNDYAARRSVHLFYDYIAKGIFNTLVTVDPDLVLLGGGVSARENFAEEISVRVQQMLVKQKLIDLEFDIERCYFDNRANLIGAVINYQQ
ncbi:ROK family protein [Fundicoccus sp. Sow4_H7]|uniref:ROK family protein n=1 Tax=Fundicoccus sp. Sow4_H7 TaxID=3438784 RepID=UPI003F8DDA7F